MSPSDAIIANARLHAALDRIGRYLDAYGAPVSGDAWEEISQTIEQSVRALDLALSGSDLAARREVGTALQSLRGGDPVAVSLSAPGRNLLLLSVWPTIVSLGKHTNPIVRARWEADVQAGAMRTDSDRLAG